MTVCRICKHQLRPDDALDSTGEAHAACVEADGVAAQAPLSPIQRFLRVWWGAGHH